MKVGLIGHRGAGKTTIFNMLTGLQAQTGGFGGKEEIHLGVIKVPDARIDKLSQIFKPKKTTYAEIRFTDFPPSEGEENLKSNQALVTQMREVDAITLVLRDFGAGANPIKELNDLMTEMILADLAVVENRRSRLKKEKARLQEEALLDRCSEALENEVSLRTLSFSADEENLASGFGFLSRKPVLVIFNQSEEQAGQSLSSSYQEELDRRQLQGLALAGKVEMEIAQLDENDRTAFLREIGIEEPARERFIRASYALLNLISFFTTGEDEVRAWTITQGAVARKAAGKIHSDIERGFIRAEVVPYDEFVICGSDAKCKEAGKLRLEGKDYLVKDGDIIHFRFAV
ncbi:MAG: redox-regulated ATPase YchF [Deltaproteobacteria bacterium]|nr:MAG: redox-regulated ATPase YchF [Deltaproteobacteria bacterium]